MYLNEFFILSFFDENEFLLYNYNYLFLFNNVILEYD